MTKYGKPIWKLVLDAAYAIDKEVFTPSDIIQKIHEINPEVPATTIRTYVIAMAPNHPSSHHYPSTHKEHGYFEYLGNGKFRLLNEKEGISAKEYQKETVDKKIGKNQRKSKNKRMDRKEILMWVSKYEEDHPWWCEKEKELGDKFRKTGELTKEDLIQVVKWKFKTLKGRQSRILGLIKKNEDYEIRRISRKAFSLTSDSDFSRVELLKNLYGVGPALASTILTFYDPEQYGIFDIHVWRELFGPESTNLFTISNYLKLLREMRCVASQQNFNVRIIEKALFKKNLQGKHDYMETRRLKTLALISCTKDKQDYPCKASEMYLVSDLFRKAYAYAVNNYDSVAILSAKYGLLLPDEKIEPYDLTLNSMNSKERREWAEITFAQMKNNLPLKEITKIYFHAGKKYREYLIPKLEEAGISCEAPLAHLGIGKQKAWYKNK